MFQTAFIIIGLVFSFSAHGQLTDTTPTSSGLGGVTLGTSSPQTKSFGAVVEKQSVVRLVDRELGIVCYVAHGIAFEAGVAMQCMALPPTAQ